MVTEMCGKWSKEKLCLHKLFLVSCRGPLKCRRHDSDGHFHSFRLGSYQGRSWTCLDSSRAPLAWYDYRDKTVFTFVRIFRLGNKCRKINKGSCTPKKIRSTEVEVCYSCLFRAMWECGIVLRGLGSGD